MGRGIPPSFLRLFGFGVLEPVLRDFPLFQGLRAVRAAHQYRDRHHFTPKNAIFPPLSRVPLEAQGTSVRLVRSWNVTSVSLLQ